MFFKKEDIFLVDTLWRDPRHSLAVAGKGAGWGKAALCPTQAPLQTLVEVLVGSLAGKSPFTC